MLKINSVSVSFDVQEILKNFSCSVNAGDFIVVVGGNGAGKSTFFNTIAGKINPNKGTILIDDVDVTQWNELERASLVTRLFQNTELNCVGSLTVAQNLSISRYSRHAITLSDGMNKLSEKDGRAIMDELCMPHETLGKRMDDLSGGQRQLISFAMATQLIPKILLLDEPTAALDPQAATLLLQYAVKFIKKNAITTLLITHDPLIALHVGNKIWILDKGTITKEYSKNEKESLQPKDLMGTIEYALLS